MNCSYCAKAKDTIPAQRDYVYCSVRGEEVQTWKENMKEICKHAELRKGCIGLTLRVNKGVGGKVEERRIIYSDHDPEKILEYCVMVSNHSNRESCLRCNQVTMILISGDTFTQCKSMVNFWYGVRVIQDELLPDAYVAIEPLGKTEHNSICKTVVSAKYDPVKNELVLKME